MGKIVTPGVGEFPFVMSSLKRKGNNLVIVGTMGVWESEIYLSYQEALRFLLSRSVLLTIIMFPAVLIRGLFRRRGE